MSTAPTTAATAASTSDGGPAFPASRVLTGMTLRDYFAAKAMAALLAEHAEAIDGVAAARGVSAEEAVATDAYLMADAMLKARSAA